MSISYFAPTDHPLVPSNTIILYPQVPLQVMAKLLNYSLVITHP